MYKIQFKFKEIGQGQFLGWIESGENKVKGIIASGGDKEDIIEKLKLLFSAKIAFDYGLQFNGSIARTMHQEVNKTRSDSSIERTLSLQEA